MSASLFNQKKFKRLKKYNNDIWGIFSRRILNNPKLWYEVYPMRQIVNKTFLSNKSNKYMNKYNKSAFPNSSFTRYFQMRTFNIEKKNLALTYMPQKETKYKRALSLTHVEFNQKRMFRLFYTNIKRKQLNNIYKKAKKVKYPMRAIDSVYSQLESRLDMILFRSMFAKSVPHARQLIQHGFFLVNNKKVTYFNFIIKVGDIIQLREIENEIFFENYLEKMYDHLIKNERYIFGIIPTYLEIDYDTLTILKILEPNKDNVYYPFKFNNEDMFGLFKI